MTLAGHTDHVTCVANASRPGGRVVSGSSDATVKVWELVDEGRCLKTFTAPTSAVTCLVVTHYNGLVAGTVDGTLYEWDLYDGALASRRLLKTWTGHTEEITCVAEPSPDEVISGSFDGMLKCWDLAGEDGVHCVMTLELEAGAPTCIAILPYALFYVGSDSGEECYLDGTLRRKWHGTISVWDSADGRCVRTVSAHEDATINCVMILPCGMVISGATDGLLKLWDLNTGQCVKEIDAHSRSVRCVAAMWHGPIVTGSLSDGDGSGDARGEIKTWFDLQLALEKKTAAQVARQRACGDIATFITKFL